MRKRSKEMKTLRYYVDSEFNNAKSLISNKITSLSLSIYQQLTKINTYKLKIRDIFQSRNQTSVNQNSET